jgi:hypothetical protein
MRFEFFWGKAGEMLDGTPAEGSNGRQTELTGFFREGRQEKFWTGLLRGAVQDNKIGEGNF